ncbi:hypothetical protein P4B35_19175 [Pontiellaceae bacterium B12227]|nr:hypothetical protein [Pontiellaceae bacterium B12227]
MKYILDMVHHNPGEAPFQTRFLEPAHLAGYGFNGQVFKHINCVATFAATGVDFFPPGSAERIWLDQFTPGIQREIDAAKAEGLMVFYHIDLMVLPKRLVEYYREEICDPQTGRIQFDRPRTMELHRILFDELAERFPQVDGYIVRVGETYLFDTPHHVGNGPIPQAGPSWTPDYLYRETLDGVDPVDSRWGTPQVKAYVQLLRFLREEVCVKHGSTVMFRTWDIFPDKLHARLDHYLEVTEQIEPHPNLIFSIKHTALDFWRNTKVNECLTQGSHNQIIEVQCQREYEGKGAYPNYVMDGVINGFEENDQQIGLKDLVDAPNILGVYSWSRGGGWYGPYIQNELWPDLNAYVLAQFVKNPSRSESENFRDYAENRLGLRGGDVRRFRELCLLSARSFLKGRHCAVFDRLLNESVLPTACWMRDDCLGGHEQLAVVLKTLAENKQFTEALAEKTEAVELWTQVAALAESIDWPAGETGEFVKVSAEYGRRLFKVVHQGWRVLIAGYRADVARESPSGELFDAISCYETCWADYQALGVSPLCPSLYRGDYFSLPGEPTTPGMAASIEHYKQKYCAETIDAADVWPGIPEHHTAVSRTLIKDS